MGLHPADSKGSKCVVSVHWQCYYSNTCICPLGEVSLTSFVSPTPSSWPSGPMHRMLQTTPTRLPPTTPCTYSPWPLLTQPATYRRRGLQTRHRSMSTDPRLPRRGTWLWTDLSSRRHLPHRRPPRGRRPPRPWLRQTMGNSVFCLLSWPLAFALGSCSRWYRNFNWIFVL